MSLESFTPSLVALLLVGAATASAEAYRTGSFVLTEEEVAAMRAQSGPSARVPTGVGNVLTNPGFETGSLPPWTTNNNWMVTNADANTGTFSAENIGNFFVEQSFTPVDVTTITSVTLFSRQPEEVVQAIELFYGPADFDAILIFPTADWSQFDLTGDLRPAGQLESIRIWGYAGAGKDPDLTRVDDIVIESTTVPVELQRFSVD